MMKIKFVIDKDKEFQNLLWEVESREKVESFGLKTILPSKEIISLYEKERSKKGENKIKDYFEHYYNEQKYRKIAQKVSLEWGKYNKKFIQAVNSLSGITPMNEYNIRITLFGPGGSYLFPNTVIIRCATEEDINRAVTNIAHEIIHLLIEKPIIEKYKIDHREKEMIVSLIFEEKEFKKVFPDYPFPTYYQKPKVTLFEYLKRM